MLDICVLNSGFDFVLQVAERQVLNSLVKRFPTEPPEVCDEVMIQIMQLIHKWSNLYCAKKEENSTEFKNFHLMYRLLQSKGYKINKLTSTLPNGRLSGLKATEEIAKEHLQLQEAKLRELIRRGKPADLAKANELMKVISGYEKSEQNFVKETFSSELTWIEENLTKILGQFHKCTCLQDLYLVQDMEESLEFCKVITTKVKVIAEQEECEESLTRLLRIADSANQVLSTYEALSAVDRNNLKLIDFLSTEENSLQKTCWYSNDQNKNFSIECAIQFVEAAHIRLKFKFILKGTKEVLNFRFEAASVKETTIQVSPLSSSHLNLTNRTIEQETNVQLATPNADIQRVMIKYRLQYDAEATGMVFEGIIKLSNFI